MIDEKLQEQLRNQFNPDGSELRNLQTGMLNLLKYVDDICKRNGIQYWLSSGTCLGAIRHGGFIPWDDDLDIEMLEDDYKKLKKILLADNNGRYVFQCQDNDSDYINDFGKLRDTETHINEKSKIDRDFKYRGLFIDIFYLSPSNSHRLCYLCGSLRVLELFVYKWALDKGKGARFLRRSFHKINNVLLKCLRPLGKIGANNRLRHTLGVSFYKPRYRSDIFPLKLVPFEDMLAPVPGDCHAYLSKMYGNYMEFQVTSQHIDTDKN